MATANPTWILKVEYKGKPAGTLVYRPGKKLEIRSLTSRRLAELLKRSDEHSFHNMVGERRKNGKISEGPVLVPLRDYEAWTYVSSELSSEPDFEVEEIRVDKSARSKVNV